MRSTDAGIFHVTCRSNNEEHIFRDSGDYIAGITTLGALVTQGFLTCHGFCFMPTHYHLLATFEEGKLTPCSSETPSALLRRLQSSLQAPWPCVPLTLPIDPCRTRALRGVPPAVHRGEPAVPSVAVEQLRHGLLLRHTADVGRTTMNLVRLRRIRFVAP